MAKETFQRSKPHVNIDTIGNEDNAQSFPIKRPVIVHAGPNRPSTRSGYWPSPHKSALQITAVGRQRVGIMYPGGKSIAAPMTPGSTVLSNALESSV